MNILNISLFFAASSASLSTYVLSCLVSYWFLASKFLFSVAINSSLLYFCNVLTIIFYSLLFLVHYYSTSSITFLIFFPIYFIIIYYHLIFLVGFLQIFFLVLPIFPWSSIHHLFTRSYLLFIIIPINISSIYSLLLMLLFFLYILVLRYFIILSTYWLWSGIVC